MTAGRPASVFRKLGLRVSAPGTRQMRTHAMLPTPRLCGARIRVLFSSCDDDLRGRVYAATLDASPPYRTLAIDEQPLLDLGPPGSFDADGVNPSCLVERGGELLLYYVGWRRGPPERPYELTAGVARSRDEGLSFEKIGPVLPLSGAEPLFRTAPHVFSDGSGWAALYIGGGRFIEGPGGKRLPVYSLKLARSPDGLSWPEAGEELLAPDLSAGEIGFGRPMLIRDRDADTLVLSVRTTDGYRLCHAPWDGGAITGSSLRTLLEPGPEAWDDAMTCFGAFCHVKEEEELLFYNGNAFGRTGFGIAQRVE